MTIYKFFCQMIDRVVFFIAALAGMQIPAFLAHYRQRIDGQLSEASQTLENYQLIADRNHQGSLEALIEAFVSASDASSREIGFLIQDTQTHVSQLQVVLTGLRDGSLVQQLWHLLQHWDSQAFSATWALYQPSIVLTPQAILCALIIGLLASMCVWLLLKGPGLLKHQISHYFSVRRGRDMAKRLNHKTSR